MTLEENLRLRVTNILKDPRDSQLTARQCLARDEKILCNLLDFIEEAQREAREEALLSISQALRSIPVSYVSQPERNIYNEALDDACAVVDALSSEKILTEGIYPKPDYD